MILMIVSSYISFVNDLIEKLTFLLEKYGFIKSYKLSLNQHEFIINALTHGNENDKEKAIKYCIDLIDNNR